MSILRGTQHKRKCIGKHRCRNNQKLTRIRSDKEMILQAFKRSREVWKVLADLGVADPEEALPGPSVQTDEEIMSYIAQAMITVRCSPVRRQRTLLLMFCRVRTELLLNRGFATTACSCVET
jgi:hypothetical protein